MQWLQYPPLYRAPPDFFQAAQRQRVQWLADLARVLWRVLNGVLIQAFNPDKASMKNVKCIDRDAAWVVRRLAADSSC